MPETRTAEQLAERIIRTTITDLSQTYVLVRLADANDVLTADELGAVADDVHALLGKAVITVTWPERLPDGVEVITVTVTTDRPEGAAADIKALLAGADYHAVTVTK